MQKPCRNSLQNTKATLRSLINSKNRGMTVADLERDYQSMEGRPIPFVELGFKRLDTFLASLTDTLVCKRDGPDVRVFAIQCAHSTHIAQLVRQQKPAKNVSSQRRNLCPPQPVVLSSQPQPSRTRTRPRRNSSASAVVQQRQPLLCDPRPVVPSNGTTTTTTPAVFSNAIKVNPAATNRSESAVAPKMSTPIKPPFASEMLPLKTATTHRRAVENIAPADIISISSDSGEDSRPALVRRPFSKPHLPPRTTSSDAIKKPFSLQNGRHQNADVDRLSSELTRVVHVQPPATSAKTVAVTAPKSTFNADWALPDLSDDDPLYMMHLPASVAKFGATVPAAQLPNCLTENSVFLLNVTEVNSPTKFWFHVQNDNHPLDGLMDKLDNFYNSIALDNLPMRAHNAVAGLLCAARYNGSWHRAMVVDSYKPDKTVKLHYFDYGTTVDTPLDDIRYLLLVFAELPAQAHRGVLDGVMPINGRWCREAFETFYFFVFNTMLYGRITHFDQVDQSVRMVLVNTVLSDADVILHTVLLERNLARPRCSASKMLRSEVYPTFEMLETGKYPSITEIHNLLAQGFNFEEYLDSLVAPLDFLSSSNRSTTRPQPHFHASNPFAQDLLGDAITQDKSVTQHTAPTLNNHRLQPVRETNPFRLCGAVNY